MMAYLSVKVNGSTTERKAKSDLRNQLTIEAARRDVKLKGKPKIRVNEAMSGWWNGWAEQEVQ